jgi:phosphatidylglycerophosphate synthase
MLDAHLRPLIDPPLNFVARFLIRLGATPNLVTAAGFGFTLLNFAGLGFAHYGLALVCISLSRLMDGLDGAVARQLHFKDAGGHVHTGESDLGGFLDIVSDFVFYAGTAFFFAVGRPQDALFAAFLIFSFVASGVTFLAYAIVAAKRGLNHAQQGRKSFFYLGGLTEGTETILFFVLVCLFPAYFSVLASMFGTLCLATAAGRVKQAVVDFKR